MENETLTTLAHHGIRGQRWGIRRFQKKDGTLTPAGKKRYDSEVAKLKEREQVLKNKKRVQAKFDKLKAKKQSLDEMENELSGKGKSKTEEAVAKKKTSDKPKSVKDMTDDEIRQKITRIQLENQLAALTPQQESRGKNFLNKVVLPAGAAIGKKVGPMLLEKGADMLKKELGLDGADDVMDELKKAANIANLKKTIAESEIKQRQNEKEKKGESDDGNSSGPSNPPGGSSGPSNPPGGSFKFKRVKTPKAGDTNPLHMPTGRLTTPKRRVNPSDTDETSESFDAEPIGGSGKRYTARQTAKGKSFSFKHKDTPIYDADWTDKSDNSATNRGSTYVNNLLYAPGLPAPGLPDPNDR